MKRKNFLFWLIGGIFLFSGGIAIAHLPMHNIMHVNVHESMVKDGWTHTPPLIERLVTKNFGPDVEEKEWFDFRKEESLTKGELAVMIVKLLDKDMDAYQYHLDAKSFQQFEDRELQPASPYFGYVETCLRYGYMNGDLIPEWKVDFAGVQASVSGNVNPKKELPSNSKINIQARELGIIVDGKFTPETMELASEVTREKKFNPEEKVTKEQFLVTLIDLLDGSHTVRPKNLPPVIPGILQQAKNLNDRLTQIKDVSLSGKYPGFVITAKKYLLEADPNDTTMAQSFLTDTNGMIKEGYLFPTAPCQRYWATYLLSKCFVGKYVTPTNRKIVVAGKNEKPEIGSVTGIFMDDWNLEGVIESCDLKNMTIKIRDAAGKIQELKILDNSYVYTPYYCQDTFTSKNKKLGIIWAPEPGDYTTDIRESSVSFKPYEGSLERISLNGPPKVKIYKEGTDAICPPNIAFTEYRTLNYGPPGNPRTGVKDIKYFDVNISTYQNIHWGLYHKTRVEVGYESSRTEENGGYKYMTGRKFLEECSSQSAFYKDKEIRVYFVPDRIKDSQTPVQDSKGRYIAGFIEIGPLTTWYGIPPEHPGKNVNEEKYPVYIKCWFDLKGKAVKIDPKSQQIQIDTDMYFHYVDNNTGMMALPAPYNTFQPQWKLKDLIEDELCYRRIKEQQMYLQINEKGNLIFFESNIK